MQKNLKGVPFRLGKRFFLDGHMKNKTGTSKFGAISRAQKAQNF